MQEVVIVGGVRTPIGKFLSGLSSYSAPQLGAEVIKALTKGNNAKIDEVIMGNVISAGLGQNPARQAAILGGLPASTNAFTVNKVCGSSLKAVILAHQAIQLGEANAIIAGGMESMSNAPHILRDLRKGQKFGDAKLEDAMIIDGLWDAYAQEHMGSLVENIIKKHKISRKEQDEYSLASHRRALKTNFSKEIIAVGELKEDEGPRSDTSLTKLTKLPAAFSGCETVTAGNAAMLSDGAAALLLMAKHKAKNPIAQILGYASAHRDSKWYGLAPVLAVNKLLKKLNATLKDFDFIELNEAFAAQTLGVMKELKIDHKKINTCGGAIALGHPIGASGARILVTLINVLKARNAKQGIATLCLGGGGAVAVAIKLL